MLTQYSWLHFRYLQDFTHYRFSIICRRPGGSFRNFGLMKKRAIVEQLILAEIAKNQEHCASPLEQICLSLNIKRCVQIKQKFHDR